MWRVSEYGGANDDAADGWGPSTAVYASGAAGSSGSPLGSVKPRPADTAQWQMPPSVRENAMRPTQPEWGRLPAWAALGVLVGIAAIGAIIDLASGHRLSTVFNWSVVIATIAAVLLVRRSGIFPIVIAPPIVYALASAIVLYARSGGLHDHKVLFDGAANWLVYGFPTMAAATAVVLIVAGIRLIAHR